MEALAPKSVLTMEEALGLSRGSDGVVQKQPRFRFLKIRFPKQKIFLPVAKVEVEFRVPRQNDVTQGPPPGVFETDDEAVAKELAEVIAKSESNLFIIRATN